MVLISHQVASLKMNTASTAIRMALSAPGSIGAALASTLRTIWGKIKNSNNAIIIPKYSFFGSCP
jgi:hypothetical protein